MSFSSSATLRRHEDFSHLLNVTMKCETANWLRNKLIMCFLLILACARNVSCRWFSHTAILRRPVSPLLDVRSRYFTYTIARYSSTSSSSDSDKIVAGSSKAAPVGNDAYTASPDGANGKTETAKPSITVPTKDSVSEIVFKGLQKSYLEWLMYCNVMLQFLYVYAVICSCRTV